MILSYNAAQGESYSILSNVCWLDDSDHFFIYTYAAHGEPNSCNKEARTTESSLEGQFHELRSQNLGKLLFNLLS